jgi:hypothetical protein
LLQGIKESVEAGGGDFSFEASKDLFQCYDLLKAFDFRDWPLVPGREDGAFIPYDSADVPESRIRVIGEVGGKLVHECFEPIYDKLESNDVAEIARSAGRKPTRWKITYRFHDWEHCDCPSARLEPVIGKGYGELYHAECGRWRKSKVDGSWEEHVNNLQFGMPDDNYNGHYPTLPGNDVAHYNSTGRGMDAFRGGVPLVGDYRYDNQDRIIEERQVIRGGREITGGKAEWREASKGLELFDAGFQGHIEKLKKIKEEEKRKARLIQLENALNRGPATLSHEV